MWIQNKRKDLSFETNLESTDLAYPFKAAITNSALIFTNKLGIIPLNHYGNLVLEDLIESYHLTRAFTGHILQIVVGI